MYTVENFSSAQTFSQNMNGNYSHMKKQLNNNQYVQKISQNILSKFERDEPLEIE